MSSSNPSSCSNCNIQNSNPSFNNSGNTFRRLNINPPPKRYNPGLPNPVSGGDSSETTNVVNKIVNVTAEYGYGSGDSAKVSNKSNLQTAEVLSKVLDVDAEMVALDTGKKKVLDNTARNQMILDNDKKKTIKVVFNEGRTRKKLQNVITDEKVDKKKILKKRYRSVGTVLASSVEYKAKFNALLKDKPKIIIKDDKDDLPINFDGRVIWKDYIHPVRYQGLCGSCWAFAATFCLASRLSIYTNGKYNYILSPAKMVYCGISIPESTGSELERVENMLKSGERYDKQSKTKKSDEIYGCSGETLINTWQFLYRLGVPEDSCVLYGDENKEVKFNLTLFEDIDFSCADVTSNDFDYCKSSNKYMISHMAGGYYYVPGVKNEEDPSKSGNEYNIRNEIFKRGPCTSGMIVYEDFIDWEGDEIYEYDKKSEKVGGHAIVIMGWGEENGKKYWIVRNSWGEDWGDKGYCRILRGVNHCEIEENVFVGFPNIPGYRLSLEYPLLYQKEDYVSKYLYNIRDSGYKESVYEGIALRKIKGLTLDNLYSVDTFPNFKTFIAGKIVKENYIIYHEKEMNIKDMLFKLNDYDFLSIKHSLIFILILFLIFI